VLRLHRRQQRRLPQGATGAASPGRHSGGRAVHYGNVAVPRLALRNRQLRRRQTISPRACIFHFARVSSLSGATAGQCEAILVPGAQRNDLLATLTICVRGFASGKYRYGLPEDFQSKLKASLLFWNIERNFARCKVDRHPLEGAQLSHAEEDGRALHELERGEGWRVRECDQDMAQAQGGEF